MANDAHEEFWGCTLTNNKKELMWNYDAGSEDDVEHKLQVTSACLGSKAKNGERNLVEFTTEDDDGRKITCSMVSLRAGGVECLHLELGFNNPTKFVLKEGSGPISLCGVHLQAVPLDFDEDNSENDMSDEDVPMLVKPKAKTDGPKVLEIKNKKVTDKKDTKEVKVSGKRPLPDQKEKQPDPKKKKVQFSDKSQKPIPVDEDSSEDEDEDDDSEDEEMPSLLDGEADEGSEEDSEEDDEPEFGDDVDDDDDEEEEDSDEEDDDEEDDDDDDDDEEEEEQQPPKKNKNKKLTNGHAKPLANNKNTPAKGATTPGKGKGASTPGKTDGKTKTPAKDEKKTPLKKKEPVTPKSAGPKKTQEEMKAMLLKSPNLPKSLDKFTKFMKNNMKVTDEAGVKQMWEYVQKNKK